MCMVSCPFGAISYDGDRKSVVKCELCGGDPQCVRFCPTGALKFVAKEVAHLPKKDRFAKKLIRNRMKEAREAVGKEEDHANS